MRRSLHCLKQLFLLPAAYTKYRIVVVVMLPLLFSTAKNFAQATYTWNKTGTADWTVANNWTPDRTTPATNDILLFNNGSVTTLINIPSQSIGQLTVSNNTTVNLQAGAAGNVLSVAGLSTGDDLVVLPGSSLNNNGANAATIFVGTGATANITGSMSLSSADHRLDAADAGGITFYSPAVFTQDAGCSGNVFTTSGTHNAIVFNSGTTFIQKSGANPFGLTQPASKVVFNSGSLFKAQQSLFLSFSGRTYANVEIDFAGFNQSVTGANLLTINDLTLTQGTISLNLTGGINIKGNVTIAAGGTLHFNPATAATVTFGGSSLQTITNSGTITLGNNETVTFNNAAGVKCNSDITFNSLVNFTNGIVTITNPAILALSATASVAGASNNSFADGLVKKIGNTAFTFPSGKTGTGYVPIGISAPGSITDEYVAAYKRSSAVALSNNYAAALDHVSGVDYWTLNRTSGSSPVDVTLYWTNESSSSGSALYINDLSKLVIAHYNGTNQWDSYGGTFNTGSGFAAGSITWQGVNTFSPFSLGSTDASNPLPINLVYFNGSKKAAGNFLSWKITCYNNPNATMILQHSSDAVNYNNMTTITADALRCQQSFDYTDTHPLTGIHYYRLKMVDTSNNTTYSAAIVLSNKENKFDMLRLQPSVIKSTAVLNVSALQKTKLEVLITDVTGRVVQQRHFNLEPGSNNIMLDLSGLNAGVYEVTGYTAEGEMQTIRCIKQ